MKIPELLHPILLAALLAVLLSGPTYAGETVKEFEIAVAKAALAVENSDYAEAVRLYKQAIDLNPNSKEAAAGLGIAFARAGNLPEAKAAFYKAIYIDPADVRIRYELGVVMYRLGALQDAKSYLTTVVEKAPDEELRAAAKKYLALIAGGGSGEKQKFALTVSVGTQYDSNVILEPENPVAAPPERKSDYRAVLSADGVYHFLQSGSTTADAGYSFYQSVHARVHDFNVQQHAVKLAAAHSLSGSSQLGLKYSYTYSLVGSRRFSSVQEVIPYATFEFFPKSTTEFHVLLDVNRFYNTPLFPANSDQSGNDSTAGVIHTFRIGAATVMSVAYDFDINEADKRYWSYKGNKGTLGLQSGLAGYTGTLSLSYYDQQFRAIDPGYKRHDSMQEYSIGVSRAVARNVSLSLSDYYTIRDSNIPVYEYTRNIIGLFAVVHL